MRLEIQCEDRIGMVREVLDLFTPHHIDMRLIEVDTNRRCIYCGFPDIKFSQFQSLLAEIRRLDGVEDVKTVMFTPSEREHNALYTLLEALPDGVIAVDLKGHITMATELASHDLNVPIKDLLHRPLDRFIKGVIFSKTLFSHSNESMSKRLRIRNKTLLLEMKPVFVVDEEGVENPAGAIIHLKSEARLTRQTATLKQAPAAENHLNSYFQSDVIKSDAMQQALAKAKAFAGMMQPLFVQGEVGTGKRDFVKALYQFWQKGQSDHDVQLVIRHARHITSEDILNLDHFSGWLVIEDVECLDQDVQIDLANWLTSQPGNSTSFASACRLVSLSSVSAGDIFDTAINKALYFALATLSLSLPSLLDRKADIEGLIQQVASEVSERYKLPMPSLSKGALLKLCLYSWPGNLTELKNVLLQTMSVAKSTEWQSEDIVLPDGGISKLSLIDGSLDKTVKQWERDLLKALYPSYPSTRKLAKAVGISHSAIANKLKEYGIA